MISMEFYYKNWHHLHVCSGAPRINRGKTGKMRVDTPESWHMCLIFGRELNLDKYQLIHNNDLIPYQINQIIFLTDQFSPRSPKIIFMYFDNGFQRRSPSFPAKLTGGYTLLPIDYHFPETYI